MITYIYDSFLTGKKYQSLLAEVETKITSLGLTGKIHHLSQIRNLNDLVRRELKTSAKTIVVLGDNNLISQTATLMVGSKVPLAIIPIGENNSIANGLGVTLENCCQVLAARRVIRCDLGIIDDKHIFLQKALLNSSKLDVIIDNNYAIKINGQASLEIINFLDQVDENQETPVANPEDGIMNAIIGKKINQGFLKKPVNSYSFLSFKKLIINSGREIMLLDNSRRINNPKVISLIKKELSVVVGKERAF